MVEFTCLSELTSTMLHVVLTNGFIITYRKKWFR
jgi:hypothetical protein